MVKEIFQTEEMTAQELAEFQKDYDRWCLEVELDRIRILDNSESRTKSVNQNS